MSPKFLIEIDTDEATTEELHEAIFNAIQNLEMANGDPFYVDVPKVEVVASLIWQRNELRVAAQAVVDRWDSPAWKCVPPTGEFINRLRAAITNATKGAS